MQPTESALIVPVPDAEDAVGPFRASLDRSAAWGVPAHVTVVYPFLPPEKINDEVLDALADIISAVGQFDVAFTHVDWFDDAVVWLAPRPDRPFQDLTTAVWRRFPEAPPYGGAHADVVPHLTIGDNAEKDVLRDAAQAVATSLPVNATITVVRLIAGTPGHHPWPTIREFPLAPGRSSEGRS